MGELAPVYLLQSSGSTALTYTLDWFASPGLCLWDRVNFAGMRLRRRWFQSRQSVQMFVGLISVTKYTTSGRWAVLD